MAESRIDEAAIEVSEADLIRLVQGAFRAGMIHCVGLLGLSDRDRVAADQFAAEQVRRWKEEPMPLADRDILWFP
jgi:hypothetical protein